MLLLAFLSVLALASSRSDLTANMKCSIMADMAVLIDPTGDAKTFEMIKRAAMDAVLALNLTHSRVGVWQMSHPSKLELAMGPVNKEMFVKKIMEIKQQKAKSLVRTAAGTIATSAKAIKDLTHLLNKGLEIIPKAMLYVVASPCGKAALAAAEQARADEILLVAIAIGMKQKDVEDVYALTGGGTTKTLELPLDTEYTNTKVKHWMCSNKSDELGTQDYCPTYCLCFTRRC